MATDNQGAKRVVVLGAGMVGSAIAADLCREYQVTAVDADAGRLDRLAGAHPLTVRVADLSDPQRVRSLVAGADLVIGAVPGFMGFQTLRAVLEAGVNVVDISFFGQDPFELDALARAQGVTAVVDAGVAPGLSNMVLGYEATQMSVASFRCLVGGLPARRDWPWQYKAPFSPLDVLEEYTRPARLVEHGALVVKPALSDPELVDIEPVGTLEAFNTDGLRTLLRTMHVPDMVEKTLRYPGHIEYVRVLRESGFLGIEPVQVGEVAVRPIDLTAALLFPLWRLAPGEPEFTVMEITVRGTAQGRPRTVVYRLFDRTDEQTGMSSMARTTGYTCTAIARLVLEGRFARAGICPPEFVAAHEGCFERVVADLRARGVMLHSFDAHASTSLHLSSPRIALTNGRIVLPDRIVADRAVVIEAGRIAGLAFPGDLGSEVEAIDVAGRWISPGLVDIHIHGAVGHTFNEPTVEAFGAITAENARRGVTALLATLATAPLDDLEACLDFVRGWPRDGHGGAQVLGAHLESPYIHPAQKGALDPAHLRSPDDGSAGRLLAYADVLKIWVLAPELPGALELIARLAERGIVPAAGHSMARDADVLAAMERGLRHVTHIWSAMSSTVREGPWRRPGLLEAALTFDGLSVEMIADNRHLPPTLMKLARKCIGPDRLCVISDATGGAGLPEGAVFGMGGMTYQVRDGVGMMFDGSGFAGSATLLNRMIPVLTDVVGVSVPEAVRMASLTPARVIGWDDRKGSIAAGKDADIAIFDDDFTPWRVMIGGRWV